MYSVSVCVDFKVISRLFNVCTVYTEAQYHQVYIINGGNLGRVITSEGDVGGRTISYSWREYTVGKKASGSVQWDETLGAESVRPGYLPVH